MINSSLIVHIGLPKTGTTSLQLNLFPRLCSENRYHFNPPEYIKIKNQELIFSQDDKSNLQKAIKRENILISHEGLIGWNPFEWEASADRILDLFGKDAQIVITIRDPLDFLTSVYLQKIQEGRLVKAEEFFLSSGDHDLLDKFLLNKNSLRYDYEKLDYCRLKEMYDSRFAKVYFSPLKFINSLYPFAQLFSLDEEQIKRYKSILAVAPTRNESYSQLAIKLTFLRNTVLNFLGFKLAGSEDLLKNKPLVFAKMRKPWRWWMHEVLDKIYPYKKYVLPQSVLKRLQTELMQCNIKFVEDVEKNIDMTENE